MDPELEQPIEEQGEMPPDMVPMEEEALVEEPILLKDEEWAKDLVTIVKEFERRDQFVRLNQIRKWKKHIRYWDHLQYGWWSEVAHDWRNPDQIQDEDPQNDIDPALYAKVINIYRAHGESIIAALSNGIPFVRYFPDDADNADDISTAKSYSKIAELVQKHNVGQLLLMKALFILFNQGLACAYNENVADTKFGTYEVPEYERKKIVNQMGSCVHCGAEVSQQQIEPEMAGQPLPPIQCPTCGATDRPDLEETEQVIKQLTGYTDKPKCREVIEVYGPLHVKLPQWLTKDIKATPYLILETEEHYAMLQQTYPEIADVIIGNDGGLETYERQMRTNNAYNDEVPNDLVTLKRCWLRPWAFNTLAKHDDARVTFLKDKFPDGVFVAIINDDICAEAMPDILDDHWTVTRHPLSASLHAEPLGAALIPVQDMTNELGNITLETIEFGIPETFADPSVVDFDEYSKSEARPGQISQATVPPGQNLSAGFHEIKAASLSREVDLFATRLEKTAQFVLGAFPSVFGGAQEGGGTAREYEISRSQALQRLSITWTLVKIFWAEVMSKAVVSFAKNMATDEKMVQAKGQTFINVWIKKAEMSGKIGAVEPDVNESFPISWAQKRETIMNLIQMKNEYVDAVITHPENSSLVASIVGMPEMYIPGDDDRNKQLIEIAELVQGQPTELPPMAPPTAGGPMEGQQPPPQQSPQLMSSVEVDAELDNHEVEAETCKAWLKSELGMDAKLTNPGGYANVLAHFKQHNFFVQQAAAQEAQSQQKEKQSKQEPVNA